MGFIIGFAVFILNLLDALFTFHFIYSGGKEANPLMNYLIQHTNMWWIVPKICIGAFFFYVTATYWNNITKYGYEYFIATILIVYSILTIYHLIYVI